MNGELLPMSGHLRRRRLGSRLTAVLLLAVTVVALIAACGGSASAPLENVGAPIDGSSGAGGGPALGFSAAPSAAAASSERQPANPSQAGTADSAQIIKTGTLTLEVSDVDRAVSAAQSAVAAVGGYVSGSQRSNDGDAARATVTFRIPAARWDDTLAALRKVGTKVVAEQTAAVEVTGQVLDLGARIANLQATELALQGIMAKATKIPDVLAVEQQLSDVQGQIEQLSTEKKHLTDQAALGTLTVQFGIHTVAVAQVTKEWNPGSEVDRAVASIVGIGQGLITFGVWFLIVWLPVLAGLALVGLAAWLILRRLGLLRRPGSREPMLPASPQG